MQKTNFRFVAIVHDDVSTDGSAAIIREYAKKYPDIFMPIFETENQWSKQDGSLTRIMYDAIVKTGAKYVAMCEGDDYWISSLKLQRQVDYMESHPQCSFCAHNSLLLHTRTNAIALFNKKILRTQNYALEAFVTRDWFTPTASILYRMESLQQFEDLPSFMHGDYSLQVNLLLKEGNYLHYDNEIMSVYRDGGWASTNFKELDLYNDSITLWNYYKSKSNHRCDAIFDTLIAHEKVSIDAYLRYIENTKKSKSLYVRIGHRICRKTASLVNRYVNCLQVIKRVEIESAPNIENLQ